MERLVMWPVNDNEPPPDVVELPEWCRDGVVQTALATFTRQEVSMLLRVLARSHDRGDG